MPVTARQLPSCSVLTASERKKKKSQAHSLPVPLRTDPRRGVPPSVAPCEKEHLHFHLCRPPSSCFSFLPIFPPPSRTSLHSPSMSTNYWVGGEERGSTKTSSGPPTDPVPPFAGRSLLAIGPLSLVFWLGPRPLGHKGLIMGYDWLGCVAHHWDSPLPVPPVPPVPPPLFVFGLLPNIWASNQVAGHRGQQSVSAPLCSEPVIKPGTVSLGCPEL